MILTKVFYMFDFYGKLLWDESLVGSATDPNGKRFKNSFCFINLANKKYAKSAKSDKVIMPGISRRLGTETRKFLPF